MKRSASEPGLSYLWRHIIKEALCYWILVNIVRYWAERCTGSFLVSIYWTVHPVSSRCSKAGKNAIMAAAETVRPFVSCSFFDIFRLRHDYKLQCPERIANRSKLLEQNKHQRFVKSEFFLHIMVNHNNYSGLYNLHTAACEFQYLSLQESQLTNFREFLF